jgi:peptidoglycan/LPS O-acetylase OafA/YrhL
MLFHFVASGVLGPIFTAKLWSPAFFVCRWGYLGVHVFFVISGFVIALSVGREKVDLRYVGRFIARRSLRLDPPYWVTIALTVLMLYVFNTFMRRHDTPIPTVPDVLANLTYTTGVLHRKAVLPVLWTLCLEVQFYLLLIGMLFFDQLGRGPGRRAIGWIGASLFWLVTASSVAVIGGYWNTQAGTWQIAIGTWQHTWVRGWLPSIEGWFFLDWKLFALGAVLCWTMTRRMNPAWLIGYAAVLGYVSYQTGDVQVWTGLGAAAAVLIAAGVGRLHHGVGGRPVLFMGTVSYSVYLMHALVGPQVLGYGAAWFGRSIYVAVPLVFAGIAVSFWVAWLMHRYVERPGIEVGKMLRHKPATMREPNDPPGVPVSHDPA